MGRYDDRDLFKKLNKEKPLIKQMDKGISPGITVKKMDMGVPRTEQQRPVDILNTRTSNEVPKSEGVQRRFKEFSVKPGARKPEQRQELQTDLAEPKRTATAARQEPIERRPQRPEPLERRPQPQREPLERRPQRTEPETRTERSKTSFQVAGKQNVSEAPSATARYDIGPAQKNKPRTFRHELKFYINPRDYEMLRNAMSSLLTHDKNAVEGGYHIRSLYFDDLQDTAVAEKINGVKHRKKYRIRMYNLDSGFIRLERKIKDGELVSKDSMVLTRDEVESILTGDYSFLVEMDHPLAHDFFVELQTRGLRPVTIVDYYREAFVHHIEDVRITFDTDLRTGVFDKNIFNEDLQTVPMFDDGLMVMEVKFNHYLPQYIKVILNNAESISRSAVSKYVICRKYE